MPNVSTKATVSFYVITISGLIWNFSGIIAYLQQAYLSDERIAQLPIEDQNYYQNLPAWVTAAFAIAVFSGTLGCIALLFRKAYSLKILTLSLIAVIVQFNYNLLIQNDKIITNELIIMPLLIILVAFGLVYYSQSLKNRGFFYKV